MLMTRGSTTQLNNAADHTALLKLQGSNHWTDSCVAMLLLLEGVVTDRSLLTTIMKCCKGHLNDDRRECGKGLAGDAQVQDNHLYCVKVMHKV